MKGSILAGAAETGPVQSTKNTPSGNAKELSNKEINSKHSVSRIKHVDYTATNRNPSSVKNNPIGLNQRPDESSNFAGAGALSPKGNSQSGRGNSQGGQGGR